MKFIKAQNAFNTIAEHINAPIFKCIFDLESLGDSTLEVSSTGLYRVYLNGKDITKGFLAPYISNPDDIVYYDLYKVSKFLQEKGNTICILLGNGFANSNDNNIWEFENASFRSAPKLNVSLYINGKEVLTSSDFLVANSAITFDDLRCGERYDARLWNDDLFKPFYTNDFREPILTTITGEYKQCTADPVVIKRIIKPIRIFKSKNGFIFDFGECISGVCTLKTNGKKGQKITLIHSEMVSNGELDLSAISFDCPPKAVSIDGYVQQDEYICKEGVNVYTPYFTYHGFRYCEVRNINEEDITEDVLVANVIGSNIRKRAIFKTNNDIINKIQDCALNSCESNFVYIVTDCPQREKNGWTSEAQVCAEYFLYNYDCVNSLREWLHNIRKAQREDGAIPGIIPTGGWGFSWGNGPQWDKVIVEIPWQLYRFTNDLSILNENADSIKKYVLYLISKIKPNGLLEFGLPDWCVTGEVGDGFGSTKLEITDTLIGIDILRKSKTILELLDDFELISKIEESEKLLMKSFTKEYIKDNKVCEDSQTAQSIAIALNLFDNQKVAVNNLLRIIENDNNHMHVGVMGYNYLFNVLADNGYCEFALNLISQKTWPSFGNLIEQGATSLWEKFTEYYETDEGVKQKDGGWRNYSLNHAAFGGVSAWFIKYLLGINLVDANTIIVRPQLVNNFNVEGTFENNGKIIRVEIVDNNITIENQGFDCKLVVKDIETVITDRLSIRI